MARDRSNEGVLHRLLVTHLTTTLHCPECLRHYRGDDVLILGHENDLWILATVCAECHTQGLVFVVVEEKASQSSPLELTPEEVEAFSQMPAITMDDVLDIHLALDSLEDDFSVFCEEVRV